MAVDVGNLRTRLSFEKTGESNLTELSRDLRGLRSEMNNFQASSRAYRTSLKGMKEESDILSRRLQVQRERVAELMRRYEESKRINGENAESTRKLAAQYNNAQAELKRTEQQLERLNAIIRTQENGWTVLGQSMEKAGDRLQKFGRATTQFGKAYTMRVTTPILGAGAAALKVGMDFEAGMSQVQAISGATGKEIEALTQQAKDLGESTIFSATQAAEAQTFLAMAGFNTNQILGAMPGLLDLAASSGMDLARSADIASNILSAFNMEAEETGRVADVLAKGASTANTNVEQLGGAMKYVAPIASTLGLEIEELTAGIGMLSDSGIQGDQAGRQLRQGLLRLANPTGKASDLIEELGINVFDAQGNMKTLDMVVAELEKGLQGMDAQARASSLAILFGAESTAGWSTLLDRGSRELREYTNELKNAEGTAEEMARVMQDNAKGAMTEFKSALEGAGIAVSEHIIPSFTDLTRKGTELVRKFGELDESQQKQIIKWAGLVAAIGPTSIVLGQTTTAIGGVLKAGGSLLKLLGGGTGLIARIGMLGPAGPVGLAIAGVGALSLGVYQLFKNKSDLHKINYDLINGLMDEVDATDELISRFDLLNAKNQLTNDEMLRFLDIQTELKKATTESAIEALTKEQEELLKKSSLTNDEMDEFIELNNKVIEQSPDTVKSISDQGNALALNTQALKDLNEEKRKELLITAERELTKALENEVELLKEETRLVKELKTLEDDLQKNKQERLKAAQRVNEQEEILKGIKEEMKKLDEEMERLDGQALKDAKAKRELLGIEHYFAQQILTNRKIEKAELDGIYSKQVEKVRKANEDLDLTREQLRELDLMKHDYESLILAQAGITAERGKGIAEIEKEIARIKIAKSELEKTTDPMMKNTDGYREQVKQLDNQLTRLKNAKTELTNINELAGRTIYDKKVNISTNPSIHSLNSQLSTAIRKPLYIDTRTNQIAMYADGTSAHPGGPFIAGEKGWELGRYGNRWEMLNFGLYDRPKGYQVFTHEESKRILRSLNNIPMYADGARSRNEANRIINELNNPVQPIVIEMHITNEMDGREVGRTVERYVTEIQNRNRRVVEGFA